MPMKTRVPIYYEPYNKARNKAWSLTRRDIWVNVYNFVQCKNFRITDIQVKDQVRDQIEEDLENV